MFGPKGVERLRAMHRGANAAWSEVVGNVGLCGCALYGKPLMRTLTVVCVLALERRRGGEFRPIHPLDFDFHPMDRRFHPMEISIDGHFSGENSLRFAPYSGKNGVSSVFHKRGFHGYISLSRLSDFRLNASN